MSEVSRKDLLLMLQRLREEETIELKTMSENTDNSLIRMCAQESMGRIEMLDGIITWVIKN